jgi:hypothetical protein
MITAQPSKCLSNNSFRELATVAASSNLAVAMESKASPFCKANGENFAIDVATHRDHLGLLGLKQFSIRCQVRQLAAK